MDVSNESAPGGLPSPGSSPFGGLDLRHVGVLAALPGELGPFLTHLESGKSAPEAGRQSAAPSAFLGVKIHSPALPGRGIQVSCAVSGVGKVAAARGAAALLACGVEALFVVGTCGGLSPKHAVGEFVHLFEAVQWDLSVREGRQAEAHRGLSEAWQEQTQGLVGFALTADRPALRWVSRQRRARAAAQGRTDGWVPVADMETAAVGAIAEQAGVPWAALRVISDAQRSLGSRILGQNRVESSFQANYQTQAGRPAESLWNWLSDRSG